MADFNEILRETLRLKADEIKELDLGRTSYHEAAHAVVANHYGIWGAAYVFGTLNPAPEEKFFIGQFALDSTRATPFRKAVIGWAGVIGETCAENGSLDEEELINIWEDFICEDTEWSATDLSMISAYSSRRRTFNQTVSILTKRIETLNRFAAFLRAHATGSETAPRVWCQLARVPNKPGFKRMLDVFPIMDSQKDLVAMVTDSPALPSLNCGAWDGVSQLASKPNPGM